MQQNIEERIELKNLFIILWYNKIWFLIFLFISIFSSAFLIKNTAKIYKSTSTIQVKADNQGSLDGTIPSGIMSSEILSFFPGVRKKEGNLIPKILGREFLTNILESKELSKELNELCNYNSPSLMSLTGVLDLLGISENNLPSVRQITEHKLNCLKDMIEIEEFVYNTIPSDAYDISVTSPNPFFSAKLANFLVQEFFQSEKSEKEMGYKNTLDFMSDILTKSRREVAYAKKNLEDFLINNPEAVGTINTRASSNQLINFFEIPNMNSFRVLNERRESFIANLNVLEEVKENKSFSSFINERPNRFSYQISYIFLDKLDQYRSKKNLNARDQQTIEKLLDNEVSRINKILAKEKPLLSAEKSKFEKVLAERDELSELQLNLQTKKVFNKAIEEGLNGKILEFDSFALEESQVYSLAYPALSASSPNIKRIVGVNVMVSLILAVIFVFFRESTNRYIYNANQLSNDIDADKVVFLPKSKLFSKSIAGTLSHKLEDFIYSLHQIGNVGCFIEVTEKGSSKLHNSKQICQLFAELAVKQNNRVLCYNLEELSQKESFKITKEKESKLPVEDEKLGIIYKNELKDLREITSARDKKDDFVFISDSSRKYNYSKFNLIKSCDFYVLIGKRGLVREKNILTFVESNSLDRGIFGGIILIG